MGFDSSQVLQLVRAGDDEEPQDPSALLIFPGFGSAAKAATN